MRQDIHKASDVLSIWLALGIVCVLMWAALILFLRAVL